jgi:peroxiredoxin family protein
MSLTELQLNRAVEDTAGEIEEIIREVLEATESKRQHFIIACELAAQVFGIAGALFLKMPGNESADRNEAVTAVLNHVSNLAKQPQS